MPVDNWLLLALIMIFSSILFCGVVPLIVRLFIARRRHRRYRLELQAIAEASPDIFAHRASIYSDPQTMTRERRDSRQYSIVYSQIPFIDDETPV